MATRSCGYSCHATRTFVPHAEEMDEDDKEAVSYHIGFSPVPVTLYSSYLGAVQVNVLQNSQGHCLMEGTVKLGAQQLKTKVIDADDYCLDSNAHYPAKVLQKYRPQLVNPMLNLAIHRTLLQLKLLCAKSLGAAQLARVNEIQRLMLACPPISSQMAQQMLPAWSSTCSEPEKRLLEKVLANDPGALQLGGGPNGQVTNSLLNKLLNTNSGVDCLFHCQQYLIWLFDEFQQVGVGTPNNALVTITGFDEDNAFFTGEYLVICKGKDMFNDMAAPDVVAHECSHGLVETLAGLEYQGESGANNEAFADAFGAAYEFHIYNKFNGDLDKTNDIAGRADWLIGEDVGKRGMPWLRNMQDPTKAQMPQPKTYKGKHWYSGQEDYGGVHTNSGVMNYCFYRLSQYMGVKEAIKLWYKCLKTLRPKSNMSAAAEALLHVSSNHASARDALIDARIITPTPADTARRQAGKKKAAVLKPLPNSVSLAEHDAIALPNNMVLLTKSWYEHLLELGKAKTELDGVMVTENEESAIEMMP